MQFGVTALGTARIGRDTTDIKWLVAGLQVFVKGENTGSRITMVLLATHWQGCNWWVNHVELNKMKAYIEMKYTKTFLEEL